MIKSFRHKGLRRFYERGDHSLIRPDLQKQVRAVLGLLDAADSPEGMRIARYKLHKLTGRPEELLVGDRERKLAHNLSL